MKRPPQSDFSKALRYARTARGLTQEDFDGVSSRVYISALERGVKQPTLPKTDSLASVLGVHPLTLLTLSYAADSRPDSIRRLLARVEEEIAILASAGE